MKFVIDVLCFHTKVHAKFITGGMRTPCLVLYKNFLLPKLSKKKNLKTLLCLFCVWQGLFLPHVKGSALCLLHICASPNQSGCSQREGQAHPPRQAQGRTLQA